MQHLLGVTRSLFLGATFALGTVAVSAATAPPSNDDVVLALQVIQRDAEAIAAGKYQGKSLQAPAHEIGVKWYEIQPLLAKNGAVLVEMRMANASITAFDNDWKHNGQARKSAKAVSASVADLLAAAKQTGEPAPSAPVSPAVSPSAGPTSSAASTSSALPAKPSPVSSTSH